jgi:hypothetical protein
MKHLWNTEGGTEAREPLEYGFRRGVEPPFLLPSTATCCASQPMVRRGSTVRVRERALEKAPEERGFLFAHRFIVEVDRLSFAAVLPLIAFVTVATHV